MTKPVIHTSDPDFAQTPRPPTRIPSHRHCREGAGTRTPRRTYPGRVIAVGFDLDLTLADTRKGIAATFAALSEKTGVSIDAATVISRLGPPLETELAYWFPAGQVLEAAAMYRAFYGDIAVPATVPMPGAVEAVEAIRSRGGRVIVVTAKSQGHAEATVRALGLDVDRVAGSLFGADKGTALRAFAADAYVGDHLADVDAARAAGVRSVAVATGPYDEAALQAYGADIVLPDLRVFPETLTELINAGPPPRQ